MLDRYSIDARWSSARHSIDIRFIVDIRSKVVRYMFDTCSIDVERWLSGWLAWMGWGGVGWIGRMGGWAGSAGVPLTAWYAPNVSINVVWMVSIDHDGRRAQIPRPLRVWLHCETKGPLQPCYSQRRPLMRDAMHGRTAPPCMLKMR